MKECPSCKTDEKTFVWNNGKDSWGVLPHYVSSCSDYKAREVKKCLDGWHTTSDR